MGRKSSTKKSVHTDVPGCFNGIWNASELEETPVARKSLSERKFSEGFEAPRNSLDIGSALFDRQQQQNHNSNSGPAQQSSDEIPFGFEFALRTPDKRGPPRLTMPSPGAAAAAAAAEPKCRSPSVIARLMGLDTLPSAEQPLNSDRKSPLGAQAWNLMADRCDFSSRHEHFSRQLSSNGTVVPPSGPLIPFSAPAAASARHKPSMSASNYEDELLLFDVLPFREQHPQEKQLQKLKDEFQSRRAKLEQLKEELMFKQLQVQRQLDRSNSLPSMPRSSSAQSAVKSKDSKEMLEAIKFLQSNKDLLVKFLQEPNSMFAKDVYDFQSPASKEALVDKRSKLGSREQQKSPKAAGFSRRLSEPAAAAAIDEESLRKNSSSDHGSRIILLKPNIRKQSTCTAPSAGPRTTRPGDSSSVALARNQLKDLDSSMDPRELAKEIARYARERVNKAMELENARRVDQELSSNGWLSADGEGSEPSSRRYTTKEYQSPQQTAASLPTSPRLSKTKSNVSSTEGRKQLLEKLKLTPAHSNERSSGPNNVIQIEVRSKKPSKVAPLEAEAASRKHHKGKLLKLFSKDPPGSKGSPDDSPRHLVRSKSASSLTEERSRGAQVLDRTHSCRQTSIKSSASEGGSKGKFSSLKSSLLGKKRSSSARSADNSTVSSPEINKHSTMKQSEAEQQDHLARACKQSAPEKAEFTQAFSKLAVDAESPRFLSLELSDAASDIHIEKSEQPSPVSVLERVFLEGSPSPVSFEDATSDLQELQSRLERLKLEESGRTCTEEKTIHLAQQQTPSQSSSYDSESSPCSRSPSCLSEEGEDQQYIRKLLEVSGFAQSVHSLEIWHSPSCPLDPCLFGKLEEQYSDPQLPSHRQTSVNRHGSRAQRKLKIGRSINQVQRRPETLHRQMLFDVVNEVLSSKFQHLWNDQPWISSLTKHGIRPVPSGKYLLQEVCRGISSYQHQYDNQEYPLENLVERDLQRGDQWMDDGQIDVLRTAARLEAEIFNNLIEEVASSLI